jgi:FixJ family two-component response regulator
VETLVGRRLATCKKLAPRQRAASFRKGFTKVHRGQVMHRMQARSQPDLVRIAATISIQLGSE